MFYPMVSIIIPVYNGSNFMREAIDSAINQTYKNIEVIVVNDGSNDDGATEHIALSYGNKIRYIKKENGGVSSALNLGIREMKGEYFSWLSHDDKYELDKIEKQIQILSKYDEKDIVVLCESKQINADSKDLSKVRSWKRFSKEGVFSGDEVLKNLLNYGAFNGCALLIPKMIFDECGTFNENLRYSQDALMWDLIFLKGFRLIYIENVCVCNRVHNKQLTQTGRSLFYKDSLFRAKITVPEILKHKSNVGLFFYLYAKKFAVWNCKDAVDFCLSINEEQRVISFKQVLFIKIMLIYGRIRPFVRRNYYKFFKKVITQ